MHFVTHNYDFRYIFMIELKEIKAIPTLMRWRGEVLQHVFGHKPDKRLLVANRQYYRAHISDGTHRALVALYDGIEVGCGAICLTDELPSPDNPTGHCAYLMNIYVREPYRRRGVGHAIVRHLLELAKVNNCNKMYLETTAEGRSMYRSLGFEEMTDMMKYHEPARR